MADNNYPQWTFDWTAAETDAFNKLKPYYEKMLELAKGDTALAKEMIQRDYDAGMRETSSQYELSAREQALAFPQEQEQFTTTMNRRGLMGSATPGAPTGGLAGKEASRLAESQNIRREAIERAKEQREFRLETGRDIGTRREDIASTREIQGLGREHQQQAGQGANTLMGIANMQYGAKVGEFTAEENRRARALAASSSGGGGGGGGNPDKSSINPSTGKAWAVDPSTGNWDDNYYERLMGHI